MANDPDDTREHGIEFGALADDLDDESYPIAQETLLERYGDHELDLVGETVPLGEVLSTEREREYENAEGVRQAVLNMVGSEAVGREEYSDRGGNTHEVDDAAETESL